MAKILKEIVLSGGVRGSSQSLEKARISRISRFFRKSHLRKHQYSVQILTKNENCVGVCSFLDPKYPCNPDFDTAVNVKLAQNSTPTRAKMRCPLERSDSDAPITNVPTPGIPWFSQPGWDPGGRGGAGAPRFCTLCDPMVGAPSWTSRKTFWDLGDFRRLPARLKLLLENQRFPRINCILTFPLCKSNIPNFRDCTTYGNQRFPAMSGNP